MAQVQYAGTGRRKNAVARVRLVPGTGKITVNGREVESYIPHADMRLVINQPFAATQTEGSYDTLVNVNGGAIALGHPVGASGARILTTLIYEMKRRNAATGLATLCIGGGQGTALIVENI